VVEQASGGGGHSRMRVATFVSIRKLQTKLNKGENILSRIDLVARRQKKSIYALTRDQAELA
jgi:hypothetical protein